jgi:hypothetical protein
MEVALSPAVGVAFNVAGNIDVVRMSLDLSLDLSLDPPIQHADLQLSLFHTAELSLVLFRREGVWGIKCEILIRNKYLLSAPGGCLGY